MNRRHKVFCLISDENIVKKELRKNNNNNLEHHKKKQQQQQVNICGMGAKYEA
jgi:hypothetical protein